MPQNLIQAAGGGPQKQTRFVPIYNSRWISGLYTNRSLLRGPLDSLYTDFYHMGSMDVLADGLNTELSIRSTMIRRPGNPRFSSVSTSAGIDAFYSFHQSDGTIKVIADSATDVEVVTPSTNTSIFTKTSGAGQGYFQGVDKSLYLVDGVDFQKYIPSGINNPNTGTPLWSFGGIAPTVGPNLTITQTGSSGVPWVANTVFSTMGFIVDANGNVQQLISVNASGTNSTQLGTTGNGQPNWNGSLGGHTTDNTVTWENRGPVGLWTPNTLYNNFSIGGTLSNPCIIYDPATDALYGNTNPGSTGTSGATRPSFTGVNGSTISDNSGHGGITWFCIKPKAGLWLASHVYTQIGTVQNNDTNGSIVEPIALTATYNPSVQPTIWQVAAVGGTSGTGGTQPIWGTVAGNQTTDGDLIWVCQGSATHQTNHNYAAWVSTTQLLFSVIKDTNNNMQVCVISGTSSGLAPSTSFVLSAASNAAGGNTTYTGTFSPTLTAGFPVTITGFTTSANNGTFIVVSCNATQLVVNNTAGAAETHAGTAVFNPWATTYGGQTVDGTATFVCVGPSTAWAALTQWYLPKPGFAPPSASQPYGGANVVDTNSVVQFVVASGKSGGSAPSWQPVGSKTTDNTATWYAISAFSAVGFSWTKGMGYCYAFKARRASDVYVSTAPPLQLPNTNSPNAVGPLGAPLGCADGTVTTASPVIQIVGANTGAQITITGLGSTDPQFDTVEIYRSTDGFGASGPYLLLTDIPMPPIVNGAAGTWKVIDFMPDTATATLPGLNELIEAPIDHVNDPPPGQFGSTQFVPASAQNTTIAASGSGLVGIVYHQGRLWGFIGNTVFASGGPDTNPGNGFTAWPPTQAFPFQSNVTRLLPTTAGLLVFTTTDLAFIGGGPAITDYYSQLIVPGLGLLSWNALTLLGGIPYLFSSDRQFISVDMSSGVTRIGHPIGDKLALFDPTQAYVTYHSFGDADHALFISDGSTQWYRCDISPAPDGKYTGPVWSPKAMIAGGFKAIASIETSPGTRQLLIGPSSAGFILARDSTFTTFSDGAASAYSAFFTMGNIMLAHPGQMARCDFIEMDFVKTGNLPTVSVLFDELNTSGGGSFESISNSFVSDPPKKFGPTATPNTLWMNRYYFSQTTPGNGADQNPLPAWCKSMQVRVDFGTDTTENELLAFTIFGSLWQEQ